MRGLERVMAADNNTDTNVASISVVGMKRPASPTDHLEREQHMNDANIKKQHTLWKSEEFKNQAIIRALVENSIGNILARNGEGKDEKNDEHPIGIAPNVKEGSRVEIRWVIENTLSDEENISNETKRIKEEVDLLKSRNTRLEINQARNFEKIMNLEKLSEDRREDIKKLFEKTNG